MEFILTKTQLLSIIKENSSKKNKTVEITGKVLDPSNMSPEEKEEFKLKEKVILDKSELDYPIVLIQLKDGKYIIFDVNHGLDLE
jgi:hypothetical protein